MTPLAISSVCEQQQRKCCWAFGCHVHSFIKLYLCQLRLQDAVAAFEGCMASSCLLPAAAFILQGQMLAALLSWPQAAFASRVEVDEAAGSVKVRARLAGTAGCCCCCCVARQHRVSDNYMPTTRECSSCSEIMPQPYLCAA